MLVRASKSIAYAGRLVEIGEEVDIAPEHAAVSCDSLLGWAVPVNRTNAARRDLENRVRLAGIAVNDAERAMHKADRLGDAAMYGAQHEQWLSARREHGEASAALKRLEETH